MPQTRDLFLIGVKLSWDLSRKTFIIPGELSRKTFITGGKFDGTKQNPVPNKEPDFG